MRAKPKGATYRNLYAWRGLIWYSRMVRVRRYRVNTDAPISRTGWEEAAEGEGGDGWLALRVWRPTARPTIPG